VRGPRVSSDLPFCFLSSQSSLLKLMVSDKLGAIHPDALRRFLTLFLERIVPRIVKTGAAARAAKPDV
ncbi:hypothetical protein, partial [Roseinatronobacter sp.]|uniref:hypothetical protein n=1 Tax=Roseinatronobacter sp. TaxID=1945755 RepID=UPI0025D5E711